MIDFRYHLVSIIAVFFALAAGIVLGAGPLKGAVDDTLKEQTSELRSENQKLREQLEVSRGQLENQDAFVGAVGSQLVAGKLAQRTVGIVAMPGADEKIVTELREDLESAGATVDLEVQIEPKWTDPNSEAVLDDLSSKLATSGTTLPEDADGYQRGATVLADALLANTSGSNAADTVHTGTVKEFEKAGLVKLAHEASTAPESLVAVAGPISGNDARERLDRLVVLTAAFDAAGGGAVLAGPVDVADDGLIGVLRHNNSAAENVSTVDSADLSSGRVAAVFALAEQLTGDVGHYGVGESADDRIPAMSATSSAGSNG